MATNFNKSRIRKLANNIYELKHNHAEINHLFLTQLETEFVRNYNFELPVPQIWPDSQDSNVLIWEWPRDKFNFDLEVTYNGLTKIGYFKTYHKQDLTPSDSIITLIFRSDGWLVLNETVAGYLI